MKAHLTVKLAAARRTISHFCVLLLVGLPVGKITAMENQLAKSRPPVIERSKSVAALFSAVVHDVESVAKNMVAAPRGRTKPQADQVLATQQKQLKTLSDRLLALDGEMVAEFEALERTLQSKGFSATVVDRNKAALKHYQEHVAALRKDLAALVDAANAAEASSLAAGFLNGMTEKSKQQRLSLDPNQLPWRSPDAAVRPPLLTASELHEKVLKTKAAAVKVAKAPPSPADLAETLEVQLTPAVRDLARELNHNPVEIYHWVHNNIRYIPSYGSIQGAEMTLHNRKGNDVDTASLLIALLRASQIPAQYAYGTVDIPVDAAMNWVGGVTVAQAAGQLFGQGGVPNVIVSGPNGPEVIRMEHVWVNAYVDYFPSRGVVQHAGDSWIPMDASFKQYQHRQAPDLSASVPFGQEQFETLIADLEFNADQQHVEGQIRGEVLDQVFDSYVADVKAYIENQPGDTSGGDVLGDLRIHVIPPQPLAAGLPFKVQAVTQQFSEIPDQLRHKFRFQLKSGEGELSRSLFTYETATAAIAGQKAALSFTPATQADADVVAAYLPQGDDPSGPLTLPAHLIRVRGELTFEGRVVASGGSLNLGSTTTAIAGFWSPADGWELTQTYPSAGEYHALALDLQGIAPNQNEVLAQRMKQTKAAHDADPNVVLSKHLVTGDTLYAAALTYFSHNDLMDQVQAGLSGVVEYRLPSLGYFNSTFGVDYVFGIPINVFSYGVTMDITLSKTMLTARDHDFQKRYRHTLTAGARKSAMEHITPEQMYAADNKDRQAISAVKALALAAAQGQTIHTITPDRAEVLNTIQIDAQARLEIAAALSAGNHVTVSERPILFGNWRGSGYIIIDTATGAGAYKISGGANGGLLETASDYSDPLAILAFLASLLDAAKILSRYMGPLSLLFGIVGAVGSGYGLYTALDGSPCQEYAVLLYGLLTAILIMVAIMAGPLLGAVAIMVMSFLSFIVDKGIAAAFVNHPLCDPNYTPVPDDL